MALEIVIRAEDDPILATKTALHIEANDVDDVNEETNAERRHYLSAEHDSYFDGASIGDKTPLGARSHVFSGDGYWDGWIPPAAGEWTVHLRLVGTDASEASETFTAV